ncbi:MAG: hypothetical protein B7Y41_01595 [Hydrogenophilales bacterium 28-61-23]|nr:MAG: hypothetical protein B7Y41_01595 [Hydrogenophilales bacterium 28-61-23]
MKPINPKHRNALASIGILLGVFLAISSLLGISACSLPGARAQPIRYFVLEVPPLAAPSAVAAKDSGNAEKPILLLREAEAGGFGQNLHLIYSRTPGTQAQYQYAFWNEAPPKRLHTLLRERLIASGFYAGVVPLGAGVQGEYQMNFRLHEFFHDATQTPGRARVKLEVELVRRSSARLIGQQVFVADVPLTGADAAGAAAGLGQASAQVLDAVIAWLTRVRPANT